MPIVRSLNETNGCAWFKVWKSIEHDLKERLPPRDFEDNCRQQILRRKIEGRIDSRLYQPNALLV